MRHIKVRAYMRTQQMNLTYSPILPTHQTTLHYSLKPLIPLFCYQRFKIPVKKWACYGNFRYICSSVLSSMTPTNQHHPPIPTDYHPLKMSNLPTSETAKKFASSWVCGKGEKH